MTDYIVKYYVTYRGVIGMYHTNEQGHILWMEDKDDFTRAAIRGIPDEQSAILEAEQVKRDPKAYRW